MRGKQGDEAETKRFLQDGDVKEGENGLLGGNGNTSNPDSAVKQPNPRCCHLSFSPSF